MNRTVVALLIALLAALAATTVSPAADWRRDAAVMDSLSRVHPRFRAAWLEERGIRDEYWQGCVVPQDSGLRCIGRWSYGPSYDVDGRVTPSETLVALARGSGVSLLRFSRQDSLTIELLADVNAGGIMKRVAVHDSLLYVGSTAGLEIWSITDERNPVQRSWVRTALNDFALEDSFAYVIARDSLRIFNFADPGNPRQVGACRDSGYVISVYNGYAYLGDRWGLYVIDARNPSSPHRIASWGSAVEQVATRGRLCYVTTFNPNQPGEIVFRILNVTNPASPVQIGSLNSAGGMDVQLVDTLAYCSGESDFNQLTIVSVADSTHPRLIGSTGTPGWRTGIWASGLANSAFVGCHWEGLQVFDTRNTSAPVRDTFLLGTHQSVDICLDNGRAYVANEMAGLKILDVSNPTRPFLLGTCDTAGQPPSMNSAVACDSFAFVGWNRPRFRTLEVTDPSRPILVGSYEITNPPEDMVLRDSFVYCAEASRFQIVNVARPRSPVLVGSCVLPGTPGELIMSDSIAYASTHGVQCVSIARPNDPLVVGSYGTVVTGLEAADTVVYGAGPYTGIIALSVANPANPRLLDSLWLTDTLWWNDVVAVDSVAYVGGERIWAVDVRDPQNLRLVPGVSWMPPYLVRRLVYAAPYLYAACYEAGVCILETAQVSISEGDGRASPELRSGALRPNPASDCATIRAGSGLESAVVRDVLGRTVRTFKPGGAVYTMDLTGLRSGLYFVELRYGSGRKVEKLVKR